MKNKLTYTAMATFLFLCAATTAWSQATAAKVQGTITSGGKPLVDAQVVLTSKDNGKTYKMKTDKNGQVVGVATPFGIYTQEVFDYSGQALSKRDTQLVAENGTTVNDGSMEVSSGG